MPLLCSGFPLLTRRIIPENVLSDWGRVLAMAESGNTGCGCLIILALLAAGGIAAFSSLKQNGWIPRSHDTPVWIQGDWLVGEYRECDMQTSTPAFEGSHYDAEDLKTLPRLFCGRAANGFFEWSETKTGTDVSWATISGDFHTLPVSYFGRLERPDKWRVSWRCQRNSNSLTCKALN
jgi:hypothetical protein